MVDRFEWFSITISEISRLWHKITADEMAVYGLKGPHVTYLLALARQENGLTGRQLAETCDKDKADVSRMMAIMEKRGLVTREGVNRYRGIFKLTEAGKDAAAHASQRVNLAMEQVDKAMTEEERLMLHTTLDTIVLHLREISRDGLPRH